MAFFDATDDRNRNGRPDDKLTHVALVEGIDRDGTLRLLHLRHGSVRPMVAHPGHPHQRRRKGKRINTYLRARRRSDSRHTPHLAGQMLVGVAALVP